MKKRLKQKEEEDNIGLIMNDQGDLSKTKQKSNILNIARQKFKEEKKAREEKRKVGALIIKFQSLSLMACQTCVAFLIICPVILQISNESQFLNVSILSFQEIEEARQQHTKAVKKNIEKRKKISKALSKRTKKGQPVMANQIKFMLDKIKTKS